MLWLYVSNDSKGDLVPGIWGTKFTDEENTKSKSDFPLFIYILHGRLFFNVVAVYARLFSVVVVQPV